MKIEYYNNLPLQYKESALKLYFNSLKEKLVPIFGNYSIAKEVLLDQLGNNQSLVAIYENKLVGILSIQTDKGGFLNPSFTKMISKYGFFNGCIKILGLVFLNHKTAPNEFYIDGVVVADEMRGKGIGSHLFSMLEEVAVDRKIQKLTLEVIDTNPKAKALYERIGFVATKQQSVKPIKIIYKFPFNSGTIMEKEIVENKCS